MTRTAKIAVTAVLLMAVVATGAVGEAADLRLPKWLIGSWADAEGAFSLYVQDSPSPRVTLRGHGDDDPNPILSLRREMYADDPFVLFFGAVVLSKTPDYGYEDAGMRFLVRGSGSDQPTVGMSFRYLEQGKVMLLLNDGAGYVSVVMERS